MHIPVLDHGYVKFIEVWGGGEYGVLLDHERGIIEAARQSTQGSFRGWEKDRKLLAHLYENKHSTPFEFAGMTIEVQAPIFVFREWHRHRTQSYSEMSARYSPLPDMNYLPGFARCQGDPATTNKQAQSVNGRTASVEEANLWLGDLAQVYRELHALYHRGLEIGVPKEVARCAMSVAHYSRMRATGNLRNWLAFLTLRMDPNAQFEIRQFANAVAKLVEVNFPETWRLFSGEGE